MLCRWKSVVLPYFFTQNIIFIYSSRFTDEGMGIRKKAEHLAGIIEKQDFVRIVTHCDADGITGGAIAKKFLDEMGIKNEVEIVNYLDPAMMENGSDFTWFIDLGNAHAEKMRKGTGVIADHHFSSNRCVHSLNPFAYGVDGETEISASGLVYLITSNFMEDDATISVIGAIGDLQDVKHTRLVGINRELLKNSRVEVKKDFRAYGRNKPLFRMLAYFSDPPISGLFRRERGAIGFLRSIGVDYRKTWNECTHEEKKRVFSSVVKLMLERGFDYASISRLFGEVYEMNGHDLREYAAILNSLGKYGEGMRGIEMCIRERFDGKEILEHHRKRISMYLKYARQRMDQHHGLYYFHGDGYIMDTVLGTIAGMILREEEIPQPVVAFAENERGIKVSVRAPRRLVEQGLNLSTAINKSARLLGGTGGGHRAAAGAIIPKGKEEEFLQILGSEIRNQLAL